MGFVPLQGSLASAGLRPDASPHRLEWTSFRRSDRDVAITADRTASPLRPTVGFASVVGRIIPSTRFLLLLLPEQATGPKSVRGDPFAIRPTRVRAEAFSGSVHDRGPSWGF
jgi:hypothetical protein